MPVAKTSMGSLVSFKFENAACVAVGTFNMYVIQPQWLTDTAKVFDEGQEFLVEANFSEPGFRFTAPSGKTKWTVNPTRIAIETTDPAEDCGATLAKILQFLPHTPIKAIGNNCAYVAPAESAIEVENIVPECRPVKIPDGFSLAQRSFHVGLRKDAARYNIQVSVTEEAVRISTNVHYPVDDTAASAAKYATDMLANRREIETLIEHILMVQIEHVATNA